MKERLPQEVKDKVKAYADKLVLCAVGGSACKEHKPMAKQMGYVEWNEWADLKIRRGHKQRQCPKCGKWLFKCEM